MYASYTMDRLCKNLAQTILAGYGLTQSVCGSATHAVADPEGV